MGRRDEEEDDEGRGEKKSGGKGEERKHNEPFITFLVNSIEF